MSYIFSSGGGGGGVTNLQDAYDGGRTITADNGAVQINTAIEGQNTLYLNRQNSGVQSGQTSQNLQILDTRAISNGETITDDYDLASIVRNYLISNGSVVTIDGSIFRTQSSVVDIPGLSTINLVSHEIVHPTQSTRGHIYLVNDITGGSTVDGDLFRTSAGLFYNFGGNEIELTASSPSQFDATVGATGADYTTVSAALSASKTRLLIIDDVTESSACAVPSTGLYVAVLKGKNINMGTNQFTFAGNYNLTFSFQDPTAKITWAYTAATNTRLFATGANTSARVTIYGGTLDNNSTQSGCYVQDVSSVAIYENVSYEPPNVSNCGIYINNALSRITSLNVTSPGTTADNVIRTDAGVFRSVRLTGTFTNSNDTATIGGDAAMIDGITNSGNAKIAINGGKLNNCTQEGGTLNLDVDSGDQSQITNLFQTAGTVTIASGSNDNRFVNCDIAGLSFAAVSSVAQFVNCEIAGALTLASSGSKFSNCDITGAVTVSGDGNMAYGCTFSSTLSISSGADGNIFDGTFNGNVSNTGAQNTIKGRLNTSITLTLNSGATYSNIDVLIDQAVTDNSGNLTNSILYNEY